MSKGNISKSLSLKKELIIDKKSTNIFSFSVPNHYVSEDKINIY